MSFIRFETSWEYTLTSELSLGRVQMEVSSTEVLNTNVTSSLIELWQLVRANWTADYYAPQVRQSHHAIFLRKRQKKKQSV